MMQEYITDSRTGAVTVRDLTAAEIAAMAVPIADQRAAASLTRAEFCIALRQIGALTFDEALSAAKGNWPTPFAASLAALPAADQEAAQIEWATAQNIQRMNHFILAVQAAIGWTDAQADALFGI